MMDGPTPQAIRSIEKNFKARKFRNLSNLPSLGPGDTIGEGDSHINYNLLPPELSDSIFDNLYREVAWQKMYHAAGEVPRLVAVQGAVATDGGKPVYRHPSDHSPPLFTFTEHVDLVRKAAEEIVGHPLNHVLVQLYRTGNDYISEHSDKTLDIVRGSSIVNASFGAQRTMRLRTKRTDARNPEAPAEQTERITQRVHMPHNSLFVLGLKTNQYWLHGITQDKRLERDRSADELAYDGCRISLTFRHIGTFLSADESLIWGQGAKSKTVEKAGRCINADTTANEQLIDAFGFENKKGAGFEWDEVYGQGFDVLNMRPLDDHKYESAAAAS